jgi:hypothetical protein
MYEFNSVAIAEPTGRPISTVSNGRTTNTTPSAPTAQADEAGYDADEEQS